MSVDEEFYQDYECDRYQEECGHYDREDDTYFYHETFAEWEKSQHFPALRPYEDNGEVANWRLILKLNKLGKAFLLTHDYLSETL